MTAVRPPVARRRPPATLRQATVLGTLLLLAACNASSPTPIPAPTTATAPTGQPPTGQPPTGRPASTPPSAGASRAPATDDLRPLLPASVDGHALSVTQFTGTDFANNPGAVSTELADLLATLGRGPADLTLATASDPSQGTDLSITAFKVRDVSAQAFLDGYLPMLRTADPAATVTQGTRDGRSIWNVTGQLGRPPQVLFASGDVLFVVSSATGSLVDAAIAAIG